MGNDYLTTHSTLIICTVIMMSNIWDHSDSERGNHLFPLVVVEVVVEEERKEMFYLTTHLFTII